jgi:hypothetical protein
MDEGRTVAEVIGDLRHHCRRDVTYGIKLVDDPGRIGTVTALGLDETLFVKRGRWGTKCWSTWIVDVAGGQLLDVVDGRHGASVTRRLADRDEGWRASSPGRRWTCRVRTAG